MTRWVPKQIIERIARIVFELFKPPQHTLPRIAERVEDDAEDWGHFRHLGDVLRRLDEYFEIMRKIKLDDPDAYSLYRQVGGQILPARTLASHLELEPFVSDDRKLPAFFMATYLVEDNGRADEWVYAKAAYFQKMSFAEGVARHQGTLYRCVIYYSDSKDSSLHFPSEYYIDVYNGGIKVLKQKISVWQPLPNGGGIHRPDWCYPRMLSECLSEYNNKHKKAISMDEMASSTFTWAVNSVVMASAAARVKVTKGSMCAVLNVDMLRTPEFFADRDMVVGETGARKRIFHIVRTHARKTARGIQYVKSHFRGSRKFMWNGYGVEITMPGKHGINPMEIDIAAHDGAEGTPATITMGKFGAVVSRWANAA